MPGFSVSFGVPGLGSAGPAPLAGKLWPEVAFALHARDLVDRSQCSLRLGPAVRVSCIRKPFHAPAFCLWELHSSDCH